MTIVAGSSPVSTAQIQQSLAGQLKLPGESPAAPSQTKPSEPAVPAPQPDSTFTAPQHAQSTQITQPLPNVSQAAADAAKAVDVPNFFEDDSPQQDSDADQTPDDTSPADVVDDESDLPTDPAAENFKILRGKIKEARQQKREFEELLNTTKSELEKFQKGEVMPEVIAAKDRRIQELEPYEKIVNLKMSREYQDAIVKPVLELNGQLDKISEDYGLPKEVLRNAVGIENRKDLNHFLSQHFDEIGAMEAKKVIDELHAIGQKAIDAEKEPDAAMQSLRAQFAEKTAQEAAQRASLFENTSKDAWSAALDKTQKEGAYKELVMHPNDPEFNKKYVEPIQAEAARQYGAFVKKCYALGMKELPTDFAAGVARMILLSIGGAFVMKDRNQAVARADAIQQNVRRTAQYVRPSLGGQNGSGTPRQAPDMSQGPMNPTQAAALAAKRSFGS